jgi:hypothetical protein
MPATIRTHGLLLTEHELSVPLDHDDPDGERITVFAREVADPDGPDRPFPLFLQGGPATASASAPSTRGCAARTCAFPPATASRRAACASSERCWA